MYYTIYTSTDYDDCIEFEENNQCLICLLPSNKKDVIKKMNEFLNINIKCNCNPNLHYKCLEKWIDKTHSCPSCRKIVSYNLNITNKYNSDNSDTSVNLVNYVTRVTHNIYINKFNMLTLRIATIFLTINIFLFFIYNCYFMNYMLRTYSNEHFNDEYLVE